MKIIITPRSQIYPLGGPAVAIVTIGNALRRVLLSSLEGFAITSAKIEGIDHEFTTIPGVVEDVTEIILNLKQIRFKRQIDEVDNELVSVSISGQDKITAGDLIHVFVPSLGDDEIDNELYTGIYLVTKLRHTFDARIKQHEIKKRWYMLPS